VSENVRENRKKIYIEGTEKRREELAL